MLTPNKVRQKRRIPSSQCRPAEVVEMVTDISAFILFVFRHQPIFSLPAKKKHESQTQKSSFWCLSISVIDKRSEQELRGS